ncbi:MAG: transposase [Alphaproteobacteria bacterium]|nr:MAG: transposase [Alphaproteobacteria bacterium]
MKNSSRKLSDTALESLGAINAMVITHPRMMKAIRQVDYCRALSKGANEPECLLILGESGVGKTTIKEFYLRRYPRTETTSGTTIPVLAAAIPVPATMKAMATALLISLGDPSALRGSLDNKTQRLYKLIRECEVEILILDEFQHFIDRDNLRVLRSVSDWLKNLISETKVPVVLTGLPYSRNVLEANEQLMRRFSSQYVLEPFGAGHDMEEFRKFLSFVADRLPFEEKPAFGNLDMGRRFFSASQGYVSKVMKIVRGAAFLAFEECEKSITLGLLERAYRERILRPEGSLDRGTPAVNPFAVDWSFANGPALVPDQAPTLIGDKPRKQNKPALGADSALTLRDVF